MKGLAISPDGKTPFGAMQSPLIHDGGTSGGYTRIVRIDLRSGKTTQFAYPLTNIDTAAKPKYSTLSETRTTFRRNWKAWRSAPTWRLAA